MTRIGTSYFVTFRSACRYYRDYVPGYTSDELQRYVARKIADGEIHIGEPPIEGTQFRRLIPGEGRYEVVSP